MQRTAPADVPGAAAPALAERRRSAGPARSRLDARQRGAHPTPARARTRPSEATVRLAACRAGTKAQARGSGDHSGHGRPEARAGAPHLRQAGQLRRCSPCCRTSVALAGCRARRMAPARRRSSAGAAEAQAGLPRCSGLDASPPSARAVSKRSQGCRGASQPPRRRLAFLFSRSCRLRMKRVQGCAGASLRAAEDRRCWLLGPGKRRRWQTRRPLRRSCRAACRREEPLGPPHYSFVL